MAAYYSDMLRQSTCVYRLYDTDGELLYVGLSLCPHYRIPTHRGRTWGKRIASHTLEWFDDREAAKTAERHAITTEQPLHNIVRPQENA